MPEKRLIAGNDRPAHPLDLRDDGADLDVRTTDQQRVDAAQVQLTKVNTLNNVGSIGPGVGPVRVNVDPSQWAGNFAAV